MYTTKRLSEFKATQEAALQPPPEGPNSGYAVINDAHDEIGTCCWGLCRYPIGPRVHDLPFPQNKILIVSYPDEDGVDITKGLLFVPVMNLPLSANRYYVINAHGRYKGLVKTCSKEDIVTTCCFCPSYAKPRSFDYRDIYQQIEIIPLHNGRFTAKSVASDGFPPYSLDHKIWYLYESVLKSYQLGEALGLDNAVRSNFLKLDLAINAIAGKWYCPFIFVKEAGELRDQMEKSMFYEVILQQFWLKMYSGIEKKRILLRGNEIMKEEMELSDGFVWFKKTGDLKGERIGLSLALWERIKWEENRNGWDEGAGSIEEVKFDGFVLVERFSFKRLDGSMALALDFIHTDKVRTS
ncbi:DUF1262 family protein (DUF1262) [Rhynchospora pubera]|uniref:DUF1262 family protein (DUF1262) n=1 Tax=Rhynchospora pubera TaxID=906938 RepID=A0AAV8H138_9POAL|nr:DUF1262 family protein (DUF1262) [Rhynchospora pubera]